MKLMNLPYYHPWQNIWFHFLHSPAQLPDDKTLRSCQGPAGGWWAECAGRRAAL